MSHALTLVLIAASSTDIDASVRNALAPYAFSDDNPLGQWDWWVYGGRFDGMLADPERGGECRDAGTEYDPTLWLARNTFRVRALPPIPTWADEVAPDSVIGLDRQWHDRHTAHLAWADDQPWRRYAQALLDANGSGVVVCVDCHL